MYIAKIIVTLRKSILDPQGKAVQHALESLEMKNVKEVRIGRYIEVKIDARNQQEAKSVAEKACQKLLANPVMEDYSVAVDKLSSEED